MQAHALNADLSSSIFVMSRFGVTRSDTSPLFWSLNWPASASPPEISEQWRTTNQNNDHLPIQNQEQILKPTLRRKATVQAKLRSPRMKSPVNAERHDEVPQSETDKPIKAASIRRFSIMSIPPTNKSRMRIVVDNRWRISRRDLWADDNAGEAMRARSLFDFVWISTLILTSNLEHVFTETLHLLYCKSTCYVWIDFRS